MSDTALNIGALPELPADGLADDDLIEIERPQPGDTPNDNHRLPVARLRAGLAGNVGDVRLSLTTPGPDWVQQGAIVQQAEYPELFAAVGLTGQTAPPGEVWEAFTPAASGGAGAPRGSVLWVGGNTLLASGTQYGTLWRSTDAGQSWQTVSVSASTNWTFDRPVRVDDGVVLFVSGAAYRSADAGQTWTHFNPFTAVVSSVALVLSPQRVLMLDGVENPALHNQIAVSTDGGASFGEPVTTAIQGGARWPLAFTPEVGGFLHTSGRFWRTVDGGLTWADTGIVGGGSSFTAFHTAVLSADVALLMNQQTLLRTADAGQSWQVVYSTLGKSVGLLSALIDIGNGGIQIISSNARLHSGDNGATWETVPGSGFSMQHATVARIPGGPLILAHSFGWYRSIGTYPYDAFSEFQVPQLVDVNAPLGAYVKGR